MSLNRNLTIGSITQLNRIITNAFTEQHPTASPQRTLSESYASSYAILKDLLKFTTELRWVLPSIRRMPMKHKMVARPYFNRVNLQPRKNCDNEFLGLYNYIRINNLHHHCDLVLHNWTIRRTNAPARPRRRTSCASRTSRRLCWCNSWTHPGSAQPGW